MSGDNYPAGVDDSMFEGPKLTDCSMCGQENVELLEDDAGEFPEHTCAECNEPLCDECFRKCPEDDAGDKVCEECAR